MFFRIRDSYKACFEVSELELNIQNIGTSAMRSVLGTFTYDQVNTLAFVGTITMSNMFPHFSRSSPIGMTSTPD